MDKINKFLDFEVKKAEGEDRTYWWTASDATRDRGGDIIVQSGWKLKNFKAAGSPILWAHQYSQPPIGNAVEASVQDDKLRLKIKFIDADVYPFAGMIETMVKNKNIRTGSVGFLPLKVEDLNEEEKKQRSENPYGRKFSQAELMEFSIVPVPAHPGALSDKNFNDVMFKTYGNTEITKTETGKESKYLPYRNEKGEIDQNMLKASMAVCLGARGGINGLDDNQKFYGHLAKIAIDNGVNAPIFREYEQEELRELFKDVWHNEVLTVIENGLDEDDKAVLPLFRGMTRKSLISARDSLNYLIEATEEKILNDIKEIDSRNEENSTLEQLTKDLAKINIALKK